MGSLLGGGSKPSGNTTTIQKSEPWEGQKGYLGSGFQEAQQLYSAGKFAPQYFPGQTVANQSPETLFAQNMVANRAVNGSPLMNSGSQSLQDTLDGKYLDVRNNPGFQQSMQDITDAYSKGTAAQTDAAFGRAGAYGGSAYNEMVGDNNRKFADSLNKTAGDLYGQERQRQLQASTLAPQYATADYNDARALMGVGADKEAYQQDQINSDVNRYNHNSQLPYNALSNFMNIVQGNYGGTQTSSDPYFRNKTGEAMGTLGQAASTAGDAYMLYNMMTMFSDSRLKENIKYLGNERGHNIYSFNYRFDPNKTKIRGVMAQEVLALHPDAVGKAGDYLTVDYNKIGIEPAVLH